MPVITASTMQELESRHQLDGRVVAVSGYWSQLALPCPFAPHESVMEGFCTGIVFNDSKERPPFSAGDPRIILPPEAANGNQLFGSQTADASAAVVLVGHVRDSRAWQCEPDQVAECASKFVIDRVAWINGKDQEVSSPSSDLTLERLHLTPDQAVAAALHDGDTLLTPYPLLVVDMNSVDPRFLGVGAQAQMDLLSNVVWYVRVRTGTFDTDGTSDGADRIVDDATGTVLAELPLAPAQNYQPARLTVDLGRKSRFDFGPGFNARAAVRSAGVPLFSDYVGAASAPLAIAAGNYELYGFVGNEEGGDTELLNCTLPITVTAGANVAYEATFTRTSCNWKQTAEPS